MTENDGALTPFGDREPQPGDGPDYHADHAAWRERQRRNTPQEADKVMWDDYDEVWHATLAGEFDPPEELGYHPGED